MYSRSSECVNRTMPPETLTSPSCSADAIADSADRPQARISTDSVGRGDDAATSSTSRALGFTSLSRSPSSVFSRLDTGSGSSGASRSACRSTARPSSSARNGLPPLAAWIRCRSEEHTSELQSLAYLVCRLLLEKKKNKKSKLNSLKNKKSIVAQLN